MKRLTVQVAAAAEAAVAAVDIEDGVQWGGGGRRSMAVAAFDGATQQLADAQREDERAAQQEDERAAQREATQQPACTIRQQ